MLDHHGFFWLFLVRRLSGILVAFAAALPLSTAAQPSLELGASSADQTNPGPQRIRGVPGGASQSQIGESNQARRPADFVPGEFEQFVRKQGAPAIEIRRFGADLITGSTDGKLGDYSPLVPDDYVVSAGDEILLTLWGSVEADLRLLVDRSGRLTVPRVGTVQVGGVRYGDLQAVVARRISSVFKNFELSVSLGKLRGIRVFVTGFVVSPGAYTVNSLSTVVGALLQAGGPAASGSFRSVELRRAGRLVATFDLYDLLLRGDRSADQIIQGGDVVHVGQVGIQIGVVGSVNKPTVLELKEHETLADALKIAGGFSAVADRSRVAVERLQERMSGRVAQFSLPGALDLKLGHGDIVRVFSAVDIALSTQRQSKRVRIEGEVHRPGEYVLPENSSVADLIRLAGGVTPAAFVFATDFTRVSVQMTQQQNYERALRDLETELARNASSTRVTSPEEASTMSVNRMAATQLVERMRALRPTGRIVLQLEPDGRDLPDLALEDGDRIYIPTKPSTVGVFGSVFNAATYLHSPGRKVSDYVRLAGGPTRGADDRAAFIVRANGTVISELQRTTGWFASGASVGDVIAQPGDTVFIPEEIGRTTLVQNLKDWTQILSQFGLGVAAVKILGN